ncbi:MAG TPA: hypothetical protein VF146_18195 [Bryobacteraceae bacterium]
MRKIQFALVVAGLLSGASSAGAQVLAAQRVGAGLPPGQVVAPNTPGGGVVVGSNLYTGDAANGFRHWKPADPANPDPVNNGILVFDSDPSKSLGGSELCFFFCKVGQIAFDGNQTAYLTAYDQAKGQPGSLTVPGVWRITIDPLTGDVTPGQQLAPRFGLAGNLPNSIALGPDGNLYVGFIKNGNVVRIVHPALSNTDPTQIVQSVGTSPNGRSIRSLTFVGADLYLATSDGLSVIKNAVASTCQGGCNGVLVPDGFIGKTHVGLASDGLDRIYVAINGAGVYRYTVSTRATQLISTGGNDPNTGAPLAFAFVGGQSNLMMLDRLGNLWIGDDASDGVFNFSGRIWYISAGQLANIP